MNNVITASLIFVVALLAGCASARFAADGRQAENVSLRAMAHNTRTPEVGNIYIHKGGNSMKILQIIGAGVLVYPVVGDGELEWRGHHAIDEKMVIYVTTTDKYVDDEFLREGLYEYVGPFQYVKVNGATKTVRMFRKVPEKTE